MFPNCLYNSWFTFTEICQPLFFFVLQPILWLLSVLIWVQIKWLMSDHTTTWTSLLQVLFVPLLMSACFLYEFFACLSKYQRGKIFLTQLTADSKFIISSCFLTNTWSVCACGWLSQHKASKRWSIMKQTALTLPALKFGRFRVSFNSVQLVSSRLMGKIDLQSTARKSSFMFFPFQWLHIDQIIPLYSSLEHRIQTFASLWAHNLIIPVSWMISWPWLSFILTDHWLWTKLFLWYCWDNFWVPCVCI